MKAYSENKKARLSYSFIKIFEAGIELTGGEVKAIREGKAQLAGSYISIESAEVFLINAFIAPYQPANSPKDYKPDRKRKLLITRAEIRSLIGQKKSKGLTLVPIKLYNKRNKIKIAFALAKGKKKGDKREAIKKQDIEREIRRNV